MIVWNRAQQLRFAERFQSLRKRQHWNLHEMARALDATFAIVDGVEKSRHLPSDKLLVRFASLERELEEARETRRSLREVPQTQKEVEPV
jgi:transcriptional regulator with XRE-family HTH domain